VSPAFFAKAGGRLFRCRRPGRLVLAARQRAIVAELRRFAPREADEGVLPYVSERSSMEHREGETSSANIFPELYRVAVFALTAAKPPVYVFSARRLRISRKSRERLPVPAASYARGDPSR